MAAAERDLAAALDWPESTPALDWPDIPVTKTPAWRHQRQAFWFAFMKRAAMLALEMGTGKSKVVVDLVVNRGHQRTLILCPKSVVAAWPKQFSLHAGRPVRVLALDKGSIAGRTETARRTLDGAIIAGEPVVVVINYEAAILPPFGPSLDKRGRIKREGFALTTGWDLVVLDESHKIKQHDGRTSRFAARLGAIAPYRLCLTGTPFAHSPLDIFGQYRFLDPTIFGESWVRFRQEYAVTHPTLPHVIRNYVRLDDLHRRFYQIAVRVTKDVLDLPETLFITRTCELGAGAAKAYKDLASNFHAELESGQITAANALVKLLRLQQVTSGTVTDDDGAVHHLDTSKRELLAEVLDELPREEPVVVFARFRADLDAVRTVCEQQGRRYGELSGRQSALATWQAGGADVLGVQIQAGGVGIDLTRARYAIYYSLGYSLAEYQQSLARIHRPGQTRGVTYVHLVASGTVDETVYAALERRQEVVETVLDAMRQNRSKR